jgi:5-methylcytosine-specific restriction endonuclease McrA
MLTTATVLALDHCYQPIAVVPWIKAITWVMKQIAEVVTEYPDLKINTPNWSVPMPSVVRFVKSFKRKRGVHFSRQNVYSRDRGRCQYCRKFVTNKDWSYDHVIPRIQGGKTCWENIVVCCFNCNQKKGGRTPQEAGMKLVTTPVKPKSLPELGPMLIYKAGMPIVWKDYLRDAVYWGIELAQD